MAGPFVVVSTIFPEEGMTDEQPSFKGRLEGEKGKKNFMALQRPIFGITLILAPILPKKCELLRETNRAITFLVLLAHFS